MAHKGAPYIPDSTEVAAMIAAAISTLSGTLAPIATSGSASDLSTGTVPAGRMPALTGDVTSGAGTVATTLAAGNATVLDNACVAYSTAALDWRATSAGNVLIPAKTGFYFCPVRYEIYAVSQTGSDPTGNLIFSIGNNVNENNLLPSTTVAAATIRPAAPPLPSAGGATNANATSAEATTGYTFKITTALGTSTTFTGRFVIIGRWISV